MKIALIGYGNMNREIEQLIAARNEHSICSVNYKNRDGFLDKKGLKHADVAIDFTAPDVVVDTIREVSQLGVPLVIGTTGWYDRLPEVASMIKQTKTGLIYGQNFSVGANLFFEITAHAGRLLHRFEGYDVFGLETHHTGKKDSPSGTARKLADILLENYPRKKRLQRDALQRKIDADELHFASVRGGRNFGRHEIVFDSDADEIRLMHQAWGRRGFAEGALLAAEFIRERNGMYDFVDVFRRHFLKQEVNNT